MNWLNSEAFSLFGQHIKWSDMIGNVIGLIGLAFGWRRSLWTWPAQFLSGLILFAAFATAHLAGSAGKQIVVMLVATYGFWQWNRGRQQAQDGSIAVRFATWRERGVLLAGAALGTLAVGGLFTAYPSLSWDPWPDAYIFVGTVVAVSHDRAFLRRLDRFLLLAHDGAVYSLPDPEAALEALAAPTRVAHVRHAKRLSLTPARR